MKLRIALFTLITAAATYAAVHANPSFPDGYPRPGFAQHSPLADGTDPYPTKKH